MDSEPFRDMYRILQDLDDERIWVFAEWVRPVSYQRCLPVTSRDFPCQHPAPGTSRSVSPTYQSSRACGQLDTTKSCTTSQMMPSEVGLTFCVLMY